MITKMYFKQITESQAEWIRRRFNVSGFSSIIPAQAIYLVVKYIDDKFSYMDIWRDIKPNRNTATEVIEIDFKDTYPIEVEMFRMYLLQSSKDVCRKLADAIISNINTIVTKTVDPVVTSVFFQEILDEINKAKVTPYKW